MKKLTFGFALAGIMFLFSGCVAEKREYFKIAQGGSGNLEVDKAQCEYQAELSATSPAPNYTDITVNVDNRQGYGSTNYSNVYSSGGGYSNMGRSGRELGRAIDLENKKTRLMDLCLRSRGWSWKVIND